LAVDRTPAILKATIQLVDEAGYDHLRMQDVADRAGVGLATIYRRWPTKQSLFIDALRSKDLDLPDTGDSRADLIDIFQRLAEGLQNENAQLVPGCIAVARDEPEIAQAFREGVSSRARAHIRMLIAREVGDDDPDLDLRADLASGILVYRGMMHGERTKGRKTFERLADIALGPWPKPGTGAPARRKPKSAARVKASR
jgi:AcrR family transcriptional regulator